MTEEIDIYANKLKFKLKDAYYKLNKDVNVNSLNSLNSSTKLIITPLSSKNLKILHSKNLNKMKRLPLKSSPLKTKNFNNSININLGKISKPKNLKLFSIKKDSQFYNNSLNSMSKNLPLIPNNSFTTSFNSTSFNSITTSITSNVNNVTGLKEELPPINKILKTPLKLSKSPLKDFTPNSLNVAKSLLQLGSGYY